MVDGGVHVRSRNRTRSARAALQVVAGCSATRRMRTIDLMLLKPYFHGTTRRSGAPFWLGRSRAVQARREERERMHAPRRCAAPRRRASPARRAAGPASARDRGESRRRRTSRARSARSAAARSPSGNAAPGDHHRPRLDAAQAVDALLERVGREQVLERPRGPASRPRRRRATDQGRGTRPPAWRAGSSLSVPNS